MEKNPLITLEDTVEELTLEIVKANIGGILAAELKENYSIVFTCQLCSPDLADLTNKTCGHDSKILLYKDHKCYVYLFKSKYFAMNYSCADRVEYIDTINKYDIHIEYEK